MKSGKRSTKSKMNLEKVEKNTRQKEFINVQTYSLSHTQARTRSQRAAHRHMNFIQICCVRVFLCFYCYYLLSFFFLFFFFISLLLLLLFLCSCLLSVARCVCVRHELMHIYKNTHTINSIQIEKQ